MDSLSWDLTEGPKGDKKIYIYHVGIELNWMELITNTWLGVVGNEVCRNPPWAGRKLLPPYIGRAEGVGQRMLCWASSLEIALVEGYNRLKRPSREGAEGKESTDLILLIHSTQAKLPGRASTVEKAQKCAWWGILKIFWAQQDLKITKTMSKEDRTVQTWRVRVLCRAAAWRRWKGRASWRNLHMQDFGGFSLV